MSGLEARAVYGPAIMAMYRVPGVTRVRIRCIPRLDPGAGRRLARIPRVVAARAEAVAVVISPAAAAVAVRPAVVDMLPAAVVAAVEPTSRIAD